MRAAAPAFGQARQKKMQINVNVSAGPPDYLSAFVHV
jgi:hypothetical protein